MQYDANKNKIPWVLLVECQKTLLNWISLLDPVIDFNRKPIPIININKKNANFNFLNLLAK